MDKHSEMVSTWNHQSRLLWSRIQTAIAVEIPILVAWYRLLASKPHWLAIVILGFGFLLLDAISLWMWRDAQYMEECERQAGDYIPKLDPLIRIGPVRLRGRDIGQLVVICFALANLGLLLLSAFFPGWVATVNS